MDQILRYLATHVDERGHAYFEFAFMTGMRPEEIIALRWGDIDWNAKTIRVERAKASGTVKPVKTYNARDVKLVSRAVAALKRMKSWTYVGGEDGEIFQNPVTGRSWYDERSQRDHYWNPTLCKLGIRRHRAYQTRHTYAAIALLAEVNPTTSPGRSATRTRVCYSPCMPGGSTERIEEGNGRSSNGFTEKPATPPNVP